MSHNCGRDYKMAAGPPCPSFVVAFHTNAWVFDALTGPAFTPVFTTHAWLTSVFVRQKDYPLFQSIAGLHV